MSYRINTNITSMNVRLATNSTNKDVQNSLAKLSSGLRINSSAEDASGMMIADSLKSQSNTLAQAIKNANDTIGMVQIADRAMNEQVKILNTIKVKAAQAAADGQATDSRIALQNDITKLLEELDNIATTTSYNGIQLLSGAFSNKKFQIGAYSKESIGLSIGDTTSAKIGSVRFEATRNLSASATAQNSTIAIKTLNGNMVTIAGVSISTSAGTGLGVLAETINKYSDKTGVRARAIVQTTATAAVKAGNINNLVINKVTLGSVALIQDGDSDGKLTNAINAIAAQTGVRAYTDEGGKMNLVSLDGRGIEIGDGSLLTGGSTTSFTSSIPPGASNFNLGTVGTVANITVDGVGIGGGYSLPSNGGVFAGDIGTYMSSQGLGATTLTYNPADGQVSATKGGVNTVTLSYDVTVASNDVNLGSFLMGVSVANGLNLGRLAYDRLGSGDIVISNSVANSGFAIFSGGASYTANLRSVGSVISAAAANAIGAFANSVQSGAASNIGAGVTTLAGAMMTMDLAESAIKQLDRIRVDMASAQNQLQATSNNVAVAQLNVAAAESQIRDVDFAQESATFSKLSIFSQAGSYALGQAMSLHNNVMRLFQ